MSSIFYETLEENNNDIINTTADIIDINEENYEPDKNKKDKRRPIPLHVLHQQRNEERRKQEEREEREERRKYNNSTSGNNALKTCYEFSSIFHDIIIRI